MAAQAVAPAKMCLRSQRLRCVASRSHVVRLNLTTYHVVERNDAPPRTLRNALRQLRECRPPQAWTYVCLTRCKRLRLPSLRLYECGAGTGPPEDGASSSRSYLPTPVYTPHQPGWTSTARSSTRFAYWHYELLRQHQGRGGSRALHPGRTPRLRRRGELGPQRPGLGGGVEGVPAAREALHRHRTLRIESDHREARPGIRGGSLLVPTGGLLPGEKGATEMFASRSLETTESVLAAYLHEMSSLQHRDLLQTLGLLHAGVNDISRLSPSSSANAISSEPEVLKAHSSYYWMPNASIVLRQV